MQARWGTHGDHPIIVLAVSSVRDSFAITVQAFNLSEKYRVPVIILSDEVVAHTRESVVLPESSDIDVVDRIAPTVPPDWFNPYEDNSRGVPPMAAFGERLPAPRHRSGPRCARFSHRAAQGSGRLHEAPVPQDHQRGRRNPDDPPDPAGRRRDGGHRLRLGVPGRPARHPPGPRAWPKAGLLQLITLFPFPKKALDRVLRQCRAVLVPELNMGQISREVKRVNMTAKVAKLNRIDGQVHYPGSDLRRTDLSCIDGIYMPESMAAASDNASICAMTKNFPMSGARAAATASSWVR